MTYLGLHSLIHDVIEFYLFFCRTTLLMNNVPHTENFRFLVFSLNLQCFNREIITKGLERTLSTGNFDIQRFKMHRKGMSQVCCIDVLLFVLVHAPIVSCVYSCYCIINHHSLMTGVT